MPRVRKRVDVNRPYWYITYRVDAIGKDKSHTRPQRKNFLGYATGPDSVSKREAERLRDEFMRTVNRADYVIQSQIPVCDLLKIFKEQHIPKLATSTQRKYLSHIKNHIEPEFGGLRLMDVDTQRLDAWYTELSKPRIDAETGERKAGLSWATRSDLNNIMSCLFNKAGDWGYWKEQNPALRANVGRKRAERSRTNYTDEELRSLLAALPEDVRRIIEMALFFALRISEVLGLQEKHLDFRTNEIRVRQRWYRGDLDETKTATSKRDIPMADMGETLRRLCKGDPERFVFSVQTRFGECRDDRDINQHFLWPTAKALGLYYPGFGFHAFKHKAVTELGQKDPMQAQKIAGHAKADMTAHYTLRDRQRQEDAIRQLQVRFLGEPEGGVQ